MLSRYYFGYGLSLVLTDSYTGSSRNHYYYDVIANNVVLANVHFRFYFTTACQGDDRGDTVVSYIYNNQNVTARIKHPKTCIDNPIVTFSVVEIDPCENIICDNICIGTNLYSQKCVNGECIPDQLLEKNSSSCGYVPPEIEEPIEEPEEEPKEDDMTKIYGLLAGIGLGAILLFKK